MNPAATSPPTRRQFLHRSATTAAALAFLFAGCFDGDDESRGADDTGARDPGSTGDDAATSTTATTRAPDPASTALEAFYAGFPLVTTVRTIQTFAQIAGVNKMFTTPGLVNPTSRQVVGPNRDTVYALAVIDLRGGSQVLTLPDIRDRYHVLQLLDAWMGNVALAGTRTTGGRARSFLLAPLGYSDQVPDGAELLPCPTDQAFLLGRIRAVDETDATEAAAVAREIRLESLPGGTGAGESTPPIGPPVGPPSATGGNGLVYWDELGDALAVNPPSTAPQRAAIDAAATLGVGPGLHPGSEAAPADAEILEAAVREGLRSLVAPEDDGVLHVSGWDVNLGLGRPSESLHRRAMVARYFWGPVPAEEAVYPRAREADDGAPLDGAKRYLVHFPPDGLPPVDAFWSLTVYGSDMFLYDNPAGRYSVSGQTPGLVTNPDGSVDVYLQADPRTGHETNWIPVPPGPFNLIMRLYLPRAPILDGTYEYPPVTVVG